MKIAGAVLAVGCTLSFMICAMPQARAADSLFTYEGGTVQAITEKESYYTSESIPVAVQYTNVSDSRKDLGSSYTPYVQLFVFDLGTPSALKNPNLAPSVFSISMTKTQQTYVMPHASEAIATATIPAYKLLSGHVYKVFVDFNVLSGAGVALDSEASKLIRTR